MNNRPDEEIEMIGFLYRLFNHDKIDALNQRLKDIDVAMTAMEAEVREYKGYKLKYKVAKMYAEDDDALLELFELAKTKERYDSQADRNAAMYGFSAMGLGQQQAAAMGQMSSLNSLAGSGLAGLGCR